MRDNYLQNGSCMFRNALDSNQIAILLSCVSKWISESPFGAEGVQPFIAKDGTQVVKYDGGYYAEYLSRNCAEVSDMLAKSVIPDLACSILGTDDVVFWRDEIHYKNSGMRTNATPWHHGIGSFPFKGTDILTIWIPITRITEDNGPLRTISGSHLDISKRFRPPTRLPSTEDDGDLYFDIPNFDRMIEVGTADVVTWIMDPGDALAFHPYTVHGSLPNKAPVERIAYASRWLGRDARYLPDAYSVLEPGIDASSLCNGRPTGPQFRNFRYNALSNLQHTPS